MRVYIESNDKEIALKYYWGVKEIAVGPGGDDDNDNDVMEFDSIEDHMDWYTSRTSWPSVLPGYIETVFLNGWDESAGTSSELEITYFEKHLDLINSTPEVDKATEWHENGKGKTNIKKYGKQIITGICTGKKLYEKISEIRDYEREVCNLTDLDFPPPDFYETRLSLLDRPISWE